MVNAGASEDINNIKRLLKQRTPSILPKSVTSTPIPGVYEVYLGGSIFYMDKTTSYVLIGGNLFNDTTKTNITTERLNLLSIIKFGDLPFHNAIEIKKGSGAYKFAIFTDPDCPYCKMLEKNLAASDATNFTAYVFLYPLKELHPDAFSKSESIWCAKDRAEAWSNFMVNNSAPEKVTCENPLESNQKLAEDLGVTGTPTVYLNNGQQTQDLQVLLAAIKEKIALQ